MLELPKTKEPHMILNVLSKLDYIHSYSRLHEGCRVGYICQEDLSS